MRNWILCGFIFLLAATAFSQEITESHINKVDLQGRRQGFWRVYDGDGNLKFTGEYVNGKPVGEFIYYFPNGRTKAIVNQLDSGRVTHMKSFHPNGRILAQGKYVNQQKDSTWLYYNAEDGSLSAEEHYINHSREGVWKTYYPEGRVAEEISYANNMKNGPWIQYFTNGNVKMKAQHVDDQLEGLYVVYHLKGGVEVSGTYLHGNKHGSWVYLNEQGELEVREEYVEGKMISRLDHTEEK